MLTLEHLKSVLNYNSDTGLFTWLRSVSSNVKSGDIAGCLNNCGYSQIYVKNKPYLAHRLAWFYFYGKWPNDQIDHINGKRTDNRIVNLRDVTNRCNSENRKNKNKSKGDLPIGVYYRKDTKKYSSQITINGVRKTVGSFNTPELAHEAYMKCKLANHKGYVHEFPD